jgi:hypothetical protein
MSKKYFILPFVVTGLFAVLFLPVACDEDMRTPQPVDNTSLPALTVSSDTVNISAGGGSYTVNVTCEGHWIAYNDPSLFPWVTISDGESTGDASFVINAEMLPFEMAERTAPVTVRLRESTKSYKELVVRQVEEEPVVEITGLTGDIPIVGGNIPIEVTSNTRWTASFSDFDSQWITITPSAGTFDCPATLTLNDNSGGHAKREFILSFRAGAALKRIPVTINQDGAAVLLSISGDFPTPANIPVEGSTYTVNITTNAVWSIGADAGWSQFEPAFGDGDATVVATVIENDLPDVRSSTITVAAVDEARVLGIRQTESDYSFIFELKYEEATTAKRLRWMKCNIIEPGEIPRQVTLGRIFKQKDLPTACPPGWRIPTVREWIDAAYDPDHRTNDGKESNLWGMHDAIGGIVEVYGQTGIYLNCFGQVPTLSTHIFFPFLEDKKTTTYYAGTKSQYLGVKIGPDKTTSIGYWAGADAQTEGIMDSNGQRVRCVQDL